MMSKRRVRSLSRERTESKRRKYRSSTFSSNYSSPDESPRRYPTRSSSRDCSYRESPTEVKARRKILSSEFVCLYDATDRDKYSLPLYVKKGESDAVILKVEPFIFKPQIFKYADSSIMDDNILKCFSECLEEVLGGLEMQNDKWIDYKDIRDRKKASLDIESQYKFAEQPKFTSKLLDIYIALTRGFYNSYARSALYSIFFLSHQLVNREAYEGVKNVGGGGTEFHGTCHTVRLYDTVKNLDGEDLQKRLQEIFIVDEIDQEKSKKWVPDVVMSKEFEDDFFLFGECKSGINVNIEKMLGQAWHQALKGLFKKSNVFACGMCANAVYLAELIICGSKLDTFTIAFDFRGPSKLKSNCFDTKRLLEFILHLAMIVEENSDQKKNSLH